jgi:signal transduction histidine kinase
VKAHRGTVTAESAGPDRGSQFTITLPGVVERPIEGGRLEEARGG